MESLGRGRGRGRMDDVFEEIVLRSRGQAPLHEADLALRGQKYRYLTINRGLVPLAAAAMWLSMSAQQWRRRPWPRAGQLRSLEPIGPSREVGQLGDTSDLGLEQEAKEREFHNLLETWENETEFLSSSRDRYMHPAYQRIIGLGEEIVPAILRELEDNTTDLFWALSAITGVDPVPPNSVGNVSEMKRSWLNWGQQQGYDW